MNHPEISPDNNQNSLRTVLRAINFSQGQLSLIFLRCNYAKLRQQISAQIHQVSSIPIKEITLTASTKSLYNQISQELGNEQPPALMISGLDSVKNIDVILNLSNQIREEFRKNFPFPILIWIDDQILKKIIRVAPDLESWGSILDFENDGEDLINLLQQTTEEIFVNDHIPSPQVYQEIEFASQDLQNRKAVINPEIQAGLNLAFGLREYQQDHLDQALSYFQKSGEFWQNNLNNNLNNNLERYGIILVKISLVYTRKAEINNGEDLENWQNSRNYLQQAVEIFEKAQRLDLVIQYINDLGKIFGHLKAWNDLENLAQKSLKLSENLETFHGTSLQPSQIMWLGQNYGFLAEVALENQDYPKANQYAQQAIDILTKIPNLPSQAYSQYRLFMSHSQVGLGEISPAIQTLETAKNQSYHQYNPKLYIAILEKLSFLYFQEKQYLKAFNLKQEKLQIEQQYGFRAFVGASYLNPQRQIINTPLPGEQRGLENLENIGTIAREISASGREQDVKRLRTRIAGTQHKLTVIHGQSGVGKSSILQGGLIPALQQEPIGERNAVPIYLRVYTNWIELLGERLKSTKSTNDQLSLHSTETIIQQLRKNADKYLLTVLIFDQFEEFFFVYTDKIQRKPFYDFFRICLDIPFVKIVLSLREDYLHYLLELDRLVDLTVTNNNILDKDIRYYLGNFSPADAQTVIQSLTEKTQFYLQTELITELVKELAGDMGEVRPIELQIVGTQLQTEQITTLAKYREFGNKEKLVEKFLKDVIKDCGSEHEQVARLVLYLLTDENNTRPLKTKDELVVKLPESENLDLVLILNIFVASGLVLLLPESPADRYQLVHDYLVEFIRQQQGNELLAKLAQAQAELKQEKEAKQIIEKARIQGEKRLKLSSGLAAGFIVIAGMASYYAGINFKKAQTAQTQLEKLNSLIRNANADLEKSQNSLKKAQIYQSYISVKPKAIIKDTKGIIGELEKHKKMGWPIGLTGDKLEPDAFLQFFNRRNLQFAFYVKSIPLGDSSAYDKNITTLNKYIKSIIYGEIEECKKQIAKHDWYYEVNKNVPQKALADLRQAWDRCFKKVSKQPRFKKKGQRDSFYLESETKAKPLIKNDGKRIKLPSIGWVRLAEPLPVTAIHNCVISRQADRWFIAIKHEVERPVLVAPRPTVGVDIGIKELAVCSHGKIFENPQAYRRKSKRMKRLQRSVSRKVKGSKNRIKAVKKLGKIHAKVSNIRQDSIHKLTYYLAKNHSVIKIEDLHVKAFLKNHKLAGAIADCGMYEFKRQLEYKTEKFGSQLILVDRFFPSSQICSNCGNHRHKMPLKNRVYVCPNCGYTEDRDLNAAKNIDRWFMDIFIPERSDMAVSSTVSACGVDKPLKSHLETTVKQEINTKMIAVQMCLDLGSFG